MQNRLVTLKSGQRNFNGTVSENKSSQYMRVDENLKYVETLGFGDKIRWYIERISENLIQEDDWINPPFDYRRALVIIPGAGIFKRVGTEVI